MKNKRFIFLIALLAFINISRAQNWNQRKYEFQYGIGIVNFMGDIAAPSNPNKLFWIHFIKTLSPIANVGLRYNFEKRHYVSGHVHVGQMYADDPLGNPNFHLARRHKFSSFFTEISAKYEFSIFEERTRRTVYKQLGETRLKNFSLPTYLFIGFGATLNIGTFTQPELGTVNTKTESYSNIAPVIPIGIGFKYKVSRYTYLNLEVGARLALNDGIDNAKGKENESYGDFIDQYQFLNINLIHKLRTNKKGFPKFRG